MMIGEALPMWARRRVIPDGVGALGGYLVPEGFVN